MKTKTAKRSSSNKQQQQQQQTNASLNTQTRRLSNTSTGTIHARTKSSNKAGSFDANTSCFKANLALKSQKVLNRDLLRCSHQPPSVSDSHTLRTPRTHHIHTFGSPSTSSSIHLGEPLRRRSISADPHVSYTTNDRFGPWPDTLLNCAALTNNELLQPIKNCRNIRNPRALSPKYDAARTDNTSKFTHDTSPETYISEYRKQKGYLLGAQIISKTFLRPLTIQQSDNEQLSTTDIDNDENDSNNHTTTDRTIVVSTDRIITLTVDRTTTLTSDRMTASTSDLSSRQNLLVKSTNNFSDHVNMPPSIPTLKKMFSESHHINSFPTIAFRNSHIRSIRHSHHHHHHTVSQQSQQQQQTVALPPLNASSLQYINGMNSIDKVYTNSKKPSIQNHSKFFLLEGRNKRRITNRINSDNEAASRSQDYSDLRATGGPVLATTQRTTAVVVCPLPRPPPTIAVNQNDIGQSS